ncbi:MAG: GAF domain-containing protein, partial [Anaerolineales bacterium]|nr:GAF domain-containing protein [Anaerolineales bacterium]
MESTVSSPVVVNTLWQQLMRQLADIFDAHGVCWASAKIIADGLGLQTIIALQGESGAYYDVWHCQPNERVKQARWIVEQASFDPFVAAETPLLQQKFDLPAGELIKSELWQLPSTALKGLPLPFPNKPATHFMPQGVLCLVDPAESVPFDDEALENIAILLTTFLDRAGLSARSQKQTVEFATVHEISHSLTSSLDQDNIFRQVSDHIRRTLNVQNLSIGLIDKPTGDIVFANILMGPLFEDMASVRIRQGQGIAGWVVEKKQPLIVNDVYHDKRFYPKIDQQSGYRTNSILAVPLIVENNVIGVIEAINKRSGDFNEHDQHLLEAISAPLSVAIENARLHADVVAEKRRIETLFASMTEGVLTVTQEGLITNSNDAVHSMLQAQDAKLIGQSIDSIIQLKRGNFSEFVKRVFRADRESPQQALDIKIHGTRATFLPVLVGGTVIEHEEKTSSEAIITFSDLSQIREFERMRDDFFHNIIHELRTPLASILMYARLLRQGRAGDDKEKEDRFLGVIERESDRLQSMVRQMLQLAKLETSDFQRSSEQVSLNRILDDLL